MQKHGKQEAQKPSKFSAYRARKAGAGRVLLRAWVSAETLEAIDRAGENRGDAIDKLIAGRTY